MIAPSRTMVKTARAMTLEKKLKGKVRHSDMMTSSDTEPHEDPDFAVTRDFMTNAYETNEWIRAIIDLTVERSCQVELFPMPIQSRVDGKGDISDAVKRKMETIAKLLLRPNSDNESFYEIRKKILKDVLIYDEAGAQIIKESKYSSEKNEYSIWTNITGEELFVNPKPDGTLPDTKTYVQYRNRETIATFDKYSFMNFIKNRRAGYANGLSPITSLAISILGDLEMVNYNYKFFQNNAKPNIAFLFENLGFGKGQGALERAKTWYNRELKGKPHLPLFMGAEKGNVKIHELRTSHKDMEFINWDLLLLSRMLAIYGCQPMVLGVLTDTTGKLNSEVQTEQFKKNAIIPLIRMLVHTMNATLIWADQNLNFDDIYLTSTNLDIEDEKKQAEIDEIYLEHGVITINQLRSKLQMNSVPWGDEPFVPLNFAPLSILEEYHQAKLAPDAADNNVKSDNADDNADDKKKKIASVSDPNYRYLINNFKVPTGLEKMSNTELKEVVTSLVKKREHFYSKAYSFPTNNAVVDTVQRFDINFNGKR